MKQRYLALGLCLTLVLSLVGCGKPQVQQEQQEPPEPKQDETINTEAPTTTPEAKQLSNEDKQELSGDELIRYFQLAYDSCTAIEVDSLKEQISFELDMIQSFCNTDGKKLPGNYTDQYIIWRPADQQPQASEVVLTFTDCNETVYATGTVNLRSGPSIDDDKVGSLSKGQSITRTGIGTGDYSSWSRAELADGSIVYVASSYLTTTKPTTQSNTQQNGGGAQNTTPGTQSGGQIYGTDDGIIYETDGDMIIRNPWAGMTPEEKAAQQEADREATQKDIEATKGIMH